MILIPELEIVLILTPRTGSGSLRRAVAAKYPKSMLVYRHMEADGVPPGYDHWEKVGVLRHPVDRLWSLYKFLKHMGNQFGQTYGEIMRSSVKVPFSDWITNNHIVFNAPYDLRWSGRFTPLHSLRHPLPENRKSQFMYLRPDLGTTVFLYEDLAVLADKLGVSLGKQNSTLVDPTPTLSAAAEEHVSRYFSWDLQQCRELDAELVTRYRNFCSMNPQIRVA